MPEALVVGAVAWFVGVQQCDDEPRLRISAPHATRRLDVLGMRLWLAHDDHKPEPGNIETYRYHVGGNGEIHPVVLVERGSQLSAGFRDLVRAHPGREFYNLPDVLSVLQEICSRPDAPSLAADALQGVLDFLLHDPTRTAQLAQAIEVAENRHVRIGRVVRGLVSTGIPICLLSRTHQSQERPTHEDLRVATLGCNTEIHARGHLRGRHDSGEERVPSVRSGRGKTPA